MSNKTEAIKRVTLLKKRAKQIISDKKKLEEIKPEILPHLINKLTQVIENIEKIENLDKELAELQKEDIEEVESQLNMPGKGNEILQNVRNNIFCSAFFTQENIDNVSSITRYLENIATVPSLIIPNLL